jgi:hypothetical protein
VQRGTQLVGVAYGRRAAANRSLGSGQREQMNVMVVKSREERAAFAVDHALAGRGIEMLADRGDALVLDTHVERSATAELDACDQHVIASDSSTWPVSAPAAHARVAAVRVRGGDTRCV